VPLTEALEAPANTTPPYTPQEQVFQYVINEYSFIKKFLKIFSGNE